MLFASYSATRVYFLHFFIFIFLILRIPPVLFQLFRLFLNYISKSKIIFADHCRFLFLDSRSNILVQPNGHP